MLFHISGPRSAFGLARAQNEYRFTERANEIGNEFI